MDIIHACVSLAPIPYLNLVFVAFRTLCTSVQRVQWSQQQLQALSTSVAHFLKTLDDEIRAGRLVESQISPEVDTLHMLIKEISSFVQTEQGRGFLKLLFNKEERIAAIEIYHRRLCSCADAFQISALVNIQDWQQRNDDARDVDRQLLNDRLTELEANQAKLREVLDVHQHNMVAMMTSMQQFMMKRLCDDREQRFITSTLSYLADVSGKHVVDIESWMVTAFDVEFGPEIGSGGFGRVFKGVWNRTQVALKVLQTDSGVTPSLALIRHEIRTWSALLHPHILQFLGANVFDDKPFIVMPLLKNGNARDYVYDHPECNRIMILHHISLGLIYLHHHNVMHGDLKALNVLIDDAGHAVLCDFGQSHIKSDATTRSMKQTMTSVVGSLNWMSPERILGGTLRKPVDIYAFGMTMFEVITGKVPLGHVAYVTFVQLVVNLDVRPERPDDDQPFKISDSLWSLLEACWAKNPQDRPTAIAVCDKIASLLAPQYPQFDASPPLSVAITPVCQAASTPTIPQDVSSDFGSSSPSNNPATPVSSYSSTQLSDGRSRSNTQSTPISSPNESESTRPTTAESIPPPKAPASLQLFIAEPTYNGPVERPAGTDYGRKQVPSPTSPTVVQEEPSANPSSDIQESLRGGPGVARPSTSDSSYSSQPSTSETSSFVEWSSKGDDFGAGPSTSTPPRRNTDHSNTARPQRRHTDPAAGNTLADGESGAEKKKRFHRMSSWLGSRLPSTRSLSPVQEISGFRIDIPRPHIPYSIGPPAEMWSLDDLLERWINRSSDIIKDEEFEEIFLMTYATFTNCLEVFEGLRLRFDAAATDDGPPQTRAFRRHSIISAVKRWVASPCMPVDPVVVTRMRQFASSVSSSSFMIEKAKEIVAAIDGKTEEYPLPSASESATTVTALLDNTSEQIAAALTALEGVMYGRIRPADYINHLRGLQGPDRVADARFTNRKITFWVMQKVLRSDLIKRRGKAFKFFLKTAEVCLQMHNFSSTAAIIVALESETIQCLLETLGELDTQDQMLLAELSGFVKSETAYRTVLDSSKDPYVPRLDLYLRDLKPVLQSCLPNLRTTAASPALVNIMGCISLTARMRDVTKFRTPAMKEPHEPERLGYLLNQLSSVEVNTAANHQLHQRSHHLKAEEKKFRASRALQISGFAA